VSIDMEVDGVMAAYERQQTVVPAGYRKERVEGLLSVQLT